MKNSYEKYLNAIPSLKEEMISQLIDWAETNSGTDNLQGLSVMLEKLKSAFQKLTPHVDELLLPPQQRVDKRGNFVERPLGKALHFSLRNDAPIQVFLGGHMDTVFSKDSPFQKTAWIDRNTLLGPGVLDMKGGLMILLKSLEILEKTPFCKEIGWHVLINPDEEIGSPGSSQLFEKYAKLCHVGLIFEPALPGGSLVSARKGSMNFTVVARGRRAHAGRDFHLGANAISALSQFILEAELLSNADAGVSINIGRISGGEALNIVPHYACLGMNVRMIHPRDMDAVKTKLFAITEAISENDGVTLELHENTARPPKPFDEQHQALFSALKTCADTLDMPLQWEPTGGVTDGNLLHAAGLPSIDSLGGVGGGIHTFDEFLLCDSLVERVRLVSLFLMQLATREIPHHFGDSHASC